MAKTPAKTTKRFPLVGLCALLLFSLLAFGGALSMWLSVWNRLPARLDWNRLDRTAYDNAIKNTDPLFVESNRLIAAADELAGPSHGVRAPTDAFKQQLGRLNHTYLSRLYQAECEIQRLQRNGAPPADWPAAIDKYVVGLENENVTHELGAFVKGWTDIYAQAGCDAGAARDAISRHPQLYAHNAVLQRLVPHLREVEAALAQSGDEAKAQSYRRVRLNLLKQWTLDPAPAGVRLLAAALLADELEQSDDAVEQKIAADLRAWRSGYHTGADRLGLSSLAVDKSVSFHPEREQALVNVLQRGAVLLGATATALLLTLASLWPVSAGRWRDATREPRTLIIVRAIVAYFLVSLTAGAVADTFIGARLVSNPWTPLIIAGVSAAIALLVLVVCSLGAIQKHPAPYAVRLAALSHAACVVLALTAFITTDTASTLRTHWDSGRAAARSDEIAAVSGPDADALLAGLRDWRPQ